MMTILHMIPTLEGGGAERQLSMLAIEQARRGFDVHVAIRRGGVYAKPMQDAGVRIHDLRNLRSVNPKLFLALGRILNSVRPALVQTWLPQMDILGGLVALRSRTPWIVTERTSKTYYAEVPFMARARLLLGRFASAVVANSAGGQDYWQENTGHSVKLVTARNALDFQAIQKPAAPAERFPSPLFLVVGRLIPEKALDVIVRAVGRLSAATAMNLLIIGDGPARATLQREIEAANLGSRAKLLPFQPDWWRWLKVADGLISMSRYEGNPNVVLEAMAGGCPLILSDIPAHREIADACSAVFVPLDDVQGLSDAITDFVAQPEAALQRAKRASARVGSMTVEAMADAYDAVYSQVLNRKS